MYYQLEAILKRMKRWLRSLGVTSGLERFIDFCRKVGITRGIVGLRDYLKKAGEVVKADLHGLPKPTVRMQIRNGVPRIYSWISPDGDAGLYRRLIKLYHVVQRGIDYGRMTKAEAREIKRSVRQDVIKLTEAVNTPSTADQGFVAQLGDLIQIGVSALQLPSWRDPKADNFGRVIEPRRVTGSSKESSECTVARDVREAYGCLSANPELRVPGWESIFLPLVPEFSRLEVEHVIGCGRKVAGAYGATVEPGLKVRGFFSPSRAVKAVEFPLYLYLSGLESGTGLSSRYCRDLARVQQWLREGRTVVSLDQSAATDRFPLSPQLRLLRYLGVPNEWIRMVLFVSRCKWITGVPAIELGFPHVMQAAVGQAMGTRVSMPLYTLTQICLLVGLCMRLAIAWEDSFRVLGDDLVISDTRLAAAYRDILIRIGVTVNDSKSFISNTYAEFAGAMITRDDIVFNGKFKSIDAHRKVSYSLILGEPVVGLDDSDYLAVVIALLLEGCIPKNVPPEVLREAKRICKDYLDFPPPCLINTEGLPNKSRYRVALRVAREYILTYSRSNSFAIDALIDKESIKSPVSSFVENVVSWLTPLASMFQPLADAPSGELFADRSLARAILSTVELYSCDLSRFYTDDVKPLKAALTMVETIISGNVAAYQERGWRTWAAYKGYIQTLEAIARASLWETRISRFRDRSLDMGILRLGRKLAKHSLPSLGVLTS